jgi:DNA-binding SARP family transcriptional activator/predicted negative regulator of RcsB-dependent stress response
MKISLLGPLLITTDDDVPVEVRGRKLRTLAAVLLCNPNQPVAVATLVDALWDLAPPRQAAANVRVYVHHLRQALGEDRISRRPAGYQMIVRPRELDVDRFDRLVAMGRDHLARHEPAKARDALRAALALWRGPALAGFEKCDILTIDAHRLEEQRLDALEQVFDTELALGQHAAIAAELRALSARNPGREKLRAQLMRALAGSGRGGEALEVFDETRRWLADEFGLDPSAALRDLYLAILRDDPTLRPTATPWPAASGPATAGSALPGSALPGSALPGPAADGKSVVREHARPRQLPARLASFSGRADPLRRLDALLSGQAATPVATITGPAGIGKTTLAVHWAHGAADHFPDGQLYLNLHGFDPARAPVEPAAVVALFLGALGVPPARVPVDLDERENLYRSLLADRRVLVLLDNAHDAGQVRPLLPGGQGCLVLVTSRNPLAGLVAAGARPVVLDLLDTGEARNLLTGRLGADRTAAEPDAVDDIVARCGGLPLPLSIVASRAMVASRFSLSALAAELGRSRRTLDGFSSDDATIDLRAVFSWSYRILGEPAARMFRLLALHPGPDATAVAAASLTGEPLATARAALAELSDASLLTQTVPGRYTYHDLVRVYALELTEGEDPPDERDAALSRLLDHYVHMAYPATLLIQPNQTPTAVGPPLAGVTVEQLTDRQQALAWFEAEHQVILAAVARAVSGFEPYAWQLGGSSIVYFERTGHWQDKLAVLAASLAATQRAGERTTEARTLRSLGLTYGRMRLYAPAYEHLQSALELYRELGDVEGQAHTISCLGEVLEYERRYPEALARAQEACELYRKVDNPVGEAHVISTLGYMHAMNGEHEQAIAPCLRALELFQAANDRPGQAAVYDSLGVAYQHLGRHTEAVTAYHAALEALAETGERYFVALVLSHLGDAHQVAEERPAAREAWHQALAILTELGHPDADEVRTKLAML